MKSTNRIATAAAFALALFAAPATFANEGNPAYEPPQKEAATQCACMSQQSAPSTPEAPVFTDQG